MKKLNQLLIFILVAGLVLMTVGIISAQQQGNQRGRQSQDRERQFDPAAMMERMMQRVMQQLNLKEDEAAIIKPKIESIMRARMDQSRETRELVDALQKAVDAKDAEQIKTKLEAVKAKRKENQAKAEAMEKELIELLTVEQEASLTLLGVVNSDGMSGFRFGGPGGPGGAGAPGAPSR